MKIRNIFYVFKKEITDIVRDKRTVISMIVIPIIGLPLLTLGIGAIMTMQMKKISEKDIRIGIIKKTDNRWLEDRISEDLNVKFIQTEDIVKSFEEKEIDLGIVLPDNFYENLDNNSSSQINLYFDASREGSRIAKSRLKSVIGDITHEISCERLKEYELSDELINPIKVDEENIASDEKMGGSILAMIVPYMILILALSGATYPAVDLTAGEKERGTLETILVSPASSVEIILGKFLTVNLTSIVASILTLSSYIFFIGAGFSFAQNLGGLKVAVPFTSVLLALLLLIPVTAMFSALLLSISLFAKSTKEAQSYIGPLMMFIIFPAMLSILPEFENSFFISIIPIANISLNLKTVLMGDVNPLHYLISFASSLFYASICIFISTQLFKREQILFRI